MMAELKKASVKSKVEAVIFSVGHKISLDEISRLCRSRKEDVLAALQELKNDYEQKQSSLMLIDDGDFWKFSVHDTYMPMVRKIVTETELTKSVMETLAVIAFKYPILQSDLIKIRTNKAYDHLVELEKAGYISRQKHGRTNLIKLTEKFFKYFDLTEDKLKEQFKDFDSIARAIKEKEEEVIKIKEDQAKKAQELRQEDEKIRKEIEELDEKEKQFEVPLETYESKPQEVVPQTGITQEKSIEKEKFGDLEVIQEKEIAQEQPKIEVNEEVEVETKKELNEMPEQQKQVIHHNQVKKQRKSKGIQATPEMQKMVDKKVEELLHGKENTETQQ